MSIGVDIGQIIDPNLFTNNSGASSANSIFPNGTVTTVSFGNLPAGSNISGQSTVQVISTAIVGALPPSVNLVSGSTLIREVGNNVVNPQFTSTANLGTNPSGTLTLLERFRGGVGGTLIASQVNPTPGVAYPITDTGFTVTSNQQYTVRVTDSLGRINTASVTFVLLYPWFYGKIIGGSKPAKDQAMINSGTKVLGASNGTIVANFASGATDWLWFAIPATSTSKTVWFESLLNNGPIGGPANLFDSEQVVSINSPTALWSGVNYKIYGSNFQTSAGTLELRN